jgi:hypothetical protein
MKMKKLFAMLMIALVVVSSVDARGGHRGGGGHWHGGGHRGGRGWHRGGRGWHGRGYWGRGWGWGPGWGYGAWLPAAAIAAGSSDTTYIVPSTTTPVAGDPYSVYQSQFGSPTANPTAYRQWLFRNYPAADAQYWWNNFLANR